GFEAGIEMALRAVLVSPEFLFRVEQDPANAAPKTAYRISNLELASRLSFFLWSSIPDDELLDAAIQGKLRPPAVPERQVPRRLPPCPRSRKTIRGSRLSPCGSVWRSIEPTRPAPAVIS